MRGDRPWCPCAQATEADVLVHVVDASSAEASAQRETVRFPRTVVVCGQLGDPEVVIDRCLVCFAHWDSTRSFWQRV